MALALLGIILATQTVRSTAELHSVLAAAQPGTTVLLEAGDYVGGQFANVHGTVGKPIVIGAADPEHRPRFTSGLQFSDISYVEIRDLVMLRATNNGINIDDAGTFETPSHHVTLRNLRVMDLPKGNHDGIKLSGLDDFRVLNCTVERWGGSGIDMVGCHRGLIRGGMFRDGGDSGVQAKGGSSEVTVQECRFENGGERAVTIGGSTGMPYFRPAVSAMPKGAAYEAKSIIVQGCTFIGSTSPIAFVGVDGATVRFNTIYNPGRWAIRILEETTDAGFVRCRNGVFLDNLVVFRSDAWASGGVNIGPETRPETFSFARNIWFCSDSPGRSKPSLPTVEKGGVYGVDPQMKDPGKGDFTVSTGRAVSVGAHAFGK